MNTTFLNGSKTELLPEAEKHAVSRLGDLAVYLGLDTDIDTVYDHVESDDVKKEILEAMHEARADRSADISDLANYDNIREYLDEAFNEYGLCFDYVELGTFGDQENDYFRYQLSYGGPSEEIRFYDNGAVEFVFLDWFVGCGYNLNNHPTGKALRQYFNELGMLDFQAEREKYDYYVILAQQAGEEEEEEE